VSAFAKDEGESVEVLAGTLRAEKAYASKDHDPETLGAGDMVMINRSIDLMEKETYDTTELHIWKAGTLVFRQTPFDSVLHRVEDWFGVTITVRGETSKAPPMTGTFTDARLDDVMRSLSLVVPFRYAIRKYSVEITL
jgi:ferric-dicitrate binding protein FerR (iron transport regulator)